MESKAKTAEDMNESEWETTGDDADETCQLCPLKDVDKEGEFRTVVRGEYRGTRVVDGKFGPSELHVLRVREDGTDYNLGVWGFIHMNRAMQTVFIGTPVQISWKGEKDVGKGNPMKMAQVEIPKGARRREVTRGSEAAPELEHQPF